MPKPLLIISHQLIIYVIAGAIMIVDIKPDENYNETEWIRKQSDLRTRQISSKLDKINTHINAINNAHETVIDLFRKAAEEHDDLADIVLARIARKYEHLFSVWAVFIAEDITAVNDIVTRCNKFRQKLENDDCLHTRKVDKPCKK